MDIAPYLGPAVTALVAAGGTYAAMSARLARIEQKVDDLAASVEKHNHVVERCAILERDQKAAWKRIEELRTDVRDMQRDGR